MVMPARGSPGKGSGDPQPLPVVLAKEGASHVLGLIEAAFGERAAPSAMTDSLQLSDAEYTEIMAFDGLVWQENERVQIAESTL